jgi:hypothetical protein
MQINGSAFLHCPSHQSVSGRNRTLEPLTRHYGICRVFQNIFHAAGMIINSSSALESSGAFSFASDAESAADGRVETDVVFSSHSLPPICFVLVFSRGQIIHLQWSASCKHLPTNKDLAWRPFLRAGEKSRKAY